MTTSGAQGCVFCDIIHHKRDKQLKANDKNTGRGVFRVYSPSSKTPHLQAVVIADQKPLAPHHYLVLSRPHIRKPGHLTHADIELVQSMELLGREYLREILKAKGEADTVEDRLRIGFHFPPALKVQHLHMHVLYPANEMSMFSRNVLFRPSAVFRTAQSILMKLEKQRGGHPLAVGEKVVNGLEAENPAVKKVDDEEKDGKKEEADDGKEENADKQVQA